MGLRPMSEPCLRHLSKEVPVRAVVIYESMFGCTRAIADAIARGLSTAVEVQLVRAADVTPETLHGISLVVVGAPTQGHGLPRSTTRRGALDYVRKSDELVKLEPGADSAAGVREWLATFRELPIGAAAFDTKVDGPTFLTGRASRGIARRLKSRGALLIAPAESFLVNKNKLLPGELQRACQWGEQLASALVRSQRRPLEVSRAPLAKERIPDRRLHQARAIQNQTAIRQRIFPMTRHSHPLNHICGL